MVKNWTLNFPGGWRQPGLACRVKAMTKVDLKKKKKIPTNPYLEKETIRAEKLNLETIVSDTVEAGTMGI